MSAFCTGNQRMSCMHWCHHIYDIVCIHGYMLIGVLCVVLEFEKEISNNFPAPGKWWDTSGSPSGSRAFIIFLENSLRCCVDVENAWSWEVKIQKIQKILFLANCLSFLCNKCNFPSLPLSPTIFYNVSPHIYDNFIFPLIVCTLSDRMEMGPDKGNRKSFSSFVCLEHDPLSGGGIHHSGYLLVHTKWLFM